MEGLGRGMPSIETSPATVAVTVKADETATPFAVTTTFPAATGAVAGTVVVIEVELLAAMVAATPPMVTLAPVRPVPVMVTIVPTWPDAGETRVITGGGGLLTVNGNVAAGETLVVTTMLPAPTVALPGTVVIICVPLLFAAFADAPPMVTLAPARLAPLMWTAAPRAPLSTERLVMLGGEVGGGKTVTVPHPPVMILRAPAA